MGVGVLSACVVEWANSPQEAAHVCFHVYLVWYVCAPCVCRIMCVRFIRRIVCVCVCREVMERLKDVSERQARKVALTETRIRERLERADTAHKAHVEEIRRKAVSENMKVCVCRVCICMCACLLASTGVPVRLNVNGMCVCLKTVMYVCVPHEHHYLRLCPLVTLAAGERSGVHQIH